MTYTGRDGQEVAIMEISCLAVSQECPLARPVSRRVIPTPQANH